jgi:conjugal transfer mating pair stabilization protein TraG
MRGEKRAMYGRMIQERATLPRSAAQVTVEEVGGALRKLGEFGSLVVAGIEGAFSTESGWSEARQAIIDARIQQVQAYGLTDAQTALFREAADAALPINLAGAHRARGTEYQQARDALVAEEGPVGEAMAELITRSVIGTQDTDLRLIAAYNRARVGEAPGASPPLSQTSVTGGRDGALLDLIAAPESGGNYNAWYGNAGQAAMDLSTLTVAQVGELQRDLVRETGGSAIGRYQIIDDTLSQLTGRMGLSGDERFTPELQDRMALVLARDAGLDDWQAGRIDDGQFAHNLSRVWAGLPMDESNLSYHEGVAGNRAGMDYDDVVASLRDIRARSS